MAPMTRVGLFLVVWVVIVLLEGTIGKNVREFAMPIAVLFIVWNLIGLAWGVRGIYRYMTR
jgi:hypothetical protein